MENTNKENRGVLFERKPASERHPNFIGSVNVNGVEYSLSAWKKQSKAGKDYISLAVSAKKETLAHESDTISIAPGESVDFSIPF